MRNFYAAIIVMTCAGCPTTSAPTAKSAAQEQSPSAIPGLPISLQLKQRSTAEVPGTDGDLSLTIDDITHGQVMVSLLHRKEANLLGPLSLKEGEAAPFRFKDSDYSVRVTDLNNQLIGDDEATLSITDATSHAMSEYEKIQQLISKVESLNGAVFIRNGSEHTPREAAEHLRRKLDSSNGNIHTAEDFIQQIATGSSISGEEYQIRFTDGRSVPAHEYLREELQHLNQLPASPESAIKP